MRQFAVIGGFCLALGACSTLNLDSANKLSTSGRVAAQSGQSFLGLPKTQAGKWVDTVSFAAAYPVPTRKERKCVGAGVVVPLSPQDKAKVKEIYAELAKASKFFSKLDEAYAALGELAAYDDQAAFKTAVTDLGGALNDYAGQSIPANIIAPIAQGVGLYVREQRKRHIKDGSAAIRAVLEAFIPVMEGRSQGLTTLTKAQIKDNYIAAKIMWCRGLLNARPMVQELAAGYGLDPLDDAPMTAKDPQLRDAVFAVLDNRSIIAQQDVDAAFNKLLAGLKELVDLHKKLEAGDPVDAEYLTARLSELRSIIELYAPRKTS